MKGGGESGLSPLRSHGPSVGLAGNRARAVSLALFVHSVPRPFTRLRVRLAAVPFIVTLVPRLSRSSSLRSSSLHSLHGPSVLTSFAPEPGRSLHSRLSSGTFPPSGFALPSPRSAVISAEVGRSFRRFPHHFPVLRETLAPLVSHTLHPPLTPAHPATLRSAPSHAPLTPRGASPTLVTHSIFSLGSRRFAHTGLRAASPGTDPREARCLSAPFIRLVSPSSRLAHFVPSARHSLATLGLSSSHSLCSLGHPHSVRPPVVSFRPSWLRLSVSSLASAGLRLGTEPARRSFTPSRFTRLRRPEGNVKRSLRSLPPTACMERVK